MLRHVTGRRLLVLVALAFAAVVFATPGYAQTGAVSGTVVDVAGKPIEKALVAIEYTDGINRKYEVKTNKKGEYIQIGLQPGGYKLTASFETLGSQSFPVRVRIGDPTKINFILGAGGANAPMTKEEAAKAAALKKAFEDGVALSKASDYDGAVAKFTEAAGMVPNCFDCYYNVGFNYMQKKDYANAETAFLKCIELKPSYVDAYNGLATVYNSEKKFDKAQEMSQKASELASAAGPGSASSGGVDAEYNQGVIAWNAGKIAEAAEHFNKVIFLKPDHADAHYQMGMALVNQGKLPEAVPFFEKYLQLAPEGQFAATAKGILSSIKK
jgi:tetratricopeptide (TPR) repeat protein